MCRRPLNGSLPALANALFDATGVWFTKLPFMPARVLAGLRAVGVGSGAASTPGATSVGGHAPAAR
jgi:hypothetical protein